MTVRSLIDLAGLGVTEEVATHEVLAELVRFGLVRPADTGYRLSESTGQSLKRLALSLEAIAYYVSAVHRDETAARVVLTKPSQPSALEFHLAQRGWRASDLEATQHAFHGLVRSAKSRVVVMTPFLDVKGAQWLKELFEVVSLNVERVLLLRSLESSERADYPVGYPQIAGWLSAIGVRVFNYSIPRTDRPGRETFHAKVLLCDDHSAYVGSSNMTAASLEYSMEMGISVTGRAAAHVGIVLDAVLASAQPWQSRP
jgi:phosphatidylserine/phosphatidylglycerophosphate/cardiolipin synthase-like enzyme